VLVGKILGAISKIAKSDN